MTNSISKPLSIIWLLTAYLIALGVAILVSLYLPSHFSLISKVFTCDVAATVVIFIFSLLLKNSSMYDPYWSVIPIYIAVYLWLIAVPEVNAIRQIIVLGLVCFWGIRLTYNFIKGWQGLVHEDWRYVNFRKNYNTIGFQFINFTGIHLFPTLLVFLGMLPVFPAVQSSTRDFGWLDVIATILTLGAILYEAIADEQLRHFIKNRKTKEEIIKTGLWKYSRHPNYFGEVMFWTGLMLFGIAAVGALVWWVIIGAVGMWLLFLFISIPMIDKKHLRNKPMYQEEIRKRSALIPWIVKP